MNKIKGLTQQEVNRSIELYGTNILIKEKKKSFFARLLENLSDPIIRILIIALVLQIILTFNSLNYFEIGGIVAAIILSGLVSTISEYKSEQAFDKLQGSGLLNIVNVLRDGEIAQINSDLIVVGDIVYLSAGEVIQADGEIIYGKISVDQSALNGESAECTKSVGNDKKWDLLSANRVFRGSVITNGSAVMRVLRVGSQTFYGEVARDVQSETRVSPLKLRLGRLAKQISGIGYVVSAIVGIAYIFNAIFVDTGFDPQRIIAFVSDWHNLFSTLVSALTLMITITIVAAPEGLPMMITVVLSANMKRMLSDKILVKKMVGIETAGSMNILFTDKTGTLTEGKPSVERIITHMGTSTKMSELRRSGEIYHTLCVSARYNTDVDTTGDKITGGNPTDRAIYEFFKNESVSRQEILTKRAFTSEKKTSSVTLKNKITLIKGAAERILRSCPYAINERGERVKLDQQSIYKEYLSAAQNGLRVIAVGLQEPGEKDSMALVALIALKDKIRSGVPDAVKVVSGAGIQTVMITGDGKETASAIAHECGILSCSTDLVIISGEDLGKMTDGEVKDLIPRLRVVYRALPSDKTRLVRLSQELDLVVGMTGDGINDAPSLKLADVGFAMGSGTEIAKSASDIVILDDSFFAILKTILYGRTIFKSIRKFITFQLTMNLAACGVSLIGQLIGVETPITIIQMLWVNIIMDTLGGLAFAGEAPLEYYMREKPKRRDEPILSGDMLNQIAITGAYTLALSLFFLASPTVRLMYGGMYPTDRLYTAFYALFIFSGIVNCFLARCSRLWLFSNISKNRPFVLIMLLISLIQLLMIYFGGTLFRCVPLMAGEISFVILLSLTILPFEMMRRLIYKMK